MSPYAKISYASKPVSATAYKAGQGATFLKDFDAAAAPVESDGFCERELSALGPLLNAQSDLCGSLKQVDTNVGFLLQVEFVEPSPVTTSWSWYLGLPFRLGNGAVVVLDGVIVQDLLGKSGYWKSVLSKATQVDTKIPPGYHVLKIYGLSTKFETSAVYFSREGSSPAIASVTAIIGEVTKWAPFVAPDPTTSSTLTAEQANKASSVGRGVSVLQFQNAPVEGRFALHLGSVSTTDAQSAKLNTSSLVSFTFVPTTTWANAKASQTAFSTAITSQWSVIPGLTLSLPSSSSGVLLCSFTGRFFVDKCMAKTFRLDLGFGSSSTPPVSSSRLDESFLDPSGVPLDFSYFSSVSTASTLNLSLSYQYQGTKTGKIIGGRATAVFIPGASLTTDTISDSTISVTATVFSKQVTVSSSSTLIIRVAGILCRNAATETFRARILRNGDPIFDGDFSSIVGTVANGSCEPLTMHSIVEAVAGSHTISIDAKTATTAGFQLKGAQVQIATVERGALLSQELCQSRCTQHGLCRLGVYNTVTRTCNLYMLRNTSSMATDSTRVSFVRNQVSAISENAWTVLRSTKWSLSQNVSLQAQCKGDTCGTSVCAEAYTLKDRCRCICQSSNNCVGFMNTDGTCYGITAADLRLNLQSGKYNASGGSTVHLNMPQTCHAIKADASNATSGRYAIATSTGIFDAFCNMTADSGEGYTVVPCDLGTSDIDCRSTAGPKDSDTCKAMGLRQIVPRSSGHLVSMHRKFGSLFFATVPGVTNAYVGDTVDLPSDEDTVLDWTAIDGGKWWLRDNGSSCDVVSPANAPDERRWLGMHASSNGQSVLDGLSLSFDPRGLATTKYLCSTNDVSPSMSWSFVLQDSFIGSGDDNLWATSWSNTDKWYQLCQGIVLLGGKSFARAGSFVSKKVAQISASDKPTNVRIKFTYYFVFDPLYWVTLLLKSSEPKTIRVYLGSQLVRQVQVDTSVTYACYGQSSTTAGQAYFYRGRERFVLRGFIGDATQLRFDIDFGSLTISAFGIDEVSMELEYAFKTPLGLSTATPAVSCMHLKTERLSNGDPNPDGQYYIQLDPNVDPVSLPCSDGWIVAQRRINGKTSFNRNWNEYRDGFGLGSTSEWWVGNNILATITARATEAMIVVSKDYQSLAALYSDFRVASENEKYLLTVRGYNATASYATDALTSLSNTYFSTPDQDNDLSASQNCAKKSRSGFWYADCLSSTRSDLNAPFDMLPICSSYSAWAQSWCQKSGSIVWNNVDGYDSSTLLLRPDRCPPGYVASKSGECSQCPAGTYSEPRSQSCNACPAGSYGPSVGASDSAACLSCPPGFKCSSSSTAPTKCVAGTFADAGSSECLNVPEGYAGPFDQMSRMDLLSCSNGTYSKPGQLNCSAVPAGFYCSQSSVPCGYTSLAPCSSRSVYCPQGNSGPTIVPPGYYSIGSLTNEQQSAISLCPRGSYCRRGIAYQCPPTRFGDQTGLVSPLCSGRCAIGCVCKAGSISRCPDAPSGVSQVALTPASISYLLAPLSKQPGETNDSFIQGVVSAMNSGAAVSTDIFEFRDVNLTFFRTGWSSGFAHNISISYFEQSQVNPKYEFQMPVAGFDWGAIVLLDGAVVVPRSKNGSLAFSFVSSWGQHVVSIIAAESQFVVKRSLLFRKTSDTSFSTLRCDRLDGQAISLQIDINLCAATAPTCKSTASINGEVARNLAQTTNSVDILVYSGTGIQSSVISADASSTATYMPTLSAMDTGGVAILIGTKLGVFPSTLRTWIKGFGISQTAIDSATSGFVFVVVNDNITPVTFDVVVPGSSYSLQLVLPLSQASAYYGLTNVPSGYYALPENAPDGRRCELKKCPPGYSCSGGVRTLSYVFPASVCVGKKHTLNVSENDAGFVSSVSFSLDVSPAGMTYQLKAPVDGVFTLDNQNRVKLQKALDYEARTAYDLTLLLQEAQATALYAACQIRVNVVDVNEAPVVTNCQVSRVIKENALPPVLLAAALGVMDPDTYDSFTLAIASGGNGNFVINREGFIVATKSLDFETTPQFVLDVVAKDLGGLESHASVVITVQDVPEPPLCAAFSFSVAENTAVGTSIGALYAHTSDPDAGDSLLYRLVSQSVPGTLTIDASTGAMTLRKALNYEVLDTIPFKVQFMDKTGLQAMCDYTIAVTDSNDAPVLTSTVFRVPENCVGNDCLVGDLAKFAFDEDKGAVLTFTLRSGSDTFSIQGSQLWAVGTVNFEMTPVLKVTVAVDDERLGHDEAAMTVQVIDVNEAPTGKVFSKKVLENIPIGTVVYTFEASDPEGDHLVFSIVRADTGFESLFGVAGGNLVTKADIDYEALSAHSFRTHIRICDPLKLCTEVGPNTIEILDGPDAPIIETAATTVSIAESASVGSAVGASFTVLDEDVGQSAQLVYAIHSGDPQNQFSISGSTGALTVSSSLNAEVVSEYKIVMQATDTDGLIGYSDPITIAVQMVPSPPYFVGTTAAKSNYNRSGPNWGSLLDYYSE
ncbi:protocadherin-like protein [Phytophthora infestans T30-4]|uniref:Protocadherin-like protein n=1 Tax=Phytophthora infestans (strain T30-4) TaxID=403677 RepID=D0NDZ9_PHYIT|nr:protocadherin-like protein [Phytophthora infestans T30-4]EEY56444.1 protocadherin-like protein [Phytophthora infestans T30-4]|eukprot:XP_002902518.1 protocadherin-like protein [Phytophthora infestans T30-4]